MTADRLEAYEYHLSMSERREAELWRELNRALAVLISPQSFDVDGVIVDIRRLLEKTR